MQLITHIYSYFKASLHDKKNIHFWFFFLSLVPSGSFACTCNDFLPHFAWYYSTTDLMFIGEIISIKENKHEEQIAKFKVITLYKGNRINKYISVIIETEQASCGFIVNKGEKWFISAEYEEDSSFFTDVCSQNFNLSNKILAREQNWIDSISKIVNISKEYYTYVEKEDTLLQGWILNGLPEGKWILNGLSIQNGSSKIKWFNTFQGYVKEIEYKNGLKEGASIEYSFNNRQKIINHQSFFSKGVMINAFIRRDEKGQLEEQYTLNKNGNKHGPHIKFYYSSNIPKSISNYYNGKKNGWHLTFYKTGVIKNKVHYKNGLKDGLDESYAPNGILKSQFYYRKGKLNSKLNSSLKK